MIGIQHYQEAESLLDWATAHQDDELTAYALQAAQVHATLALADATSRLPSADSGSMLDYRTVDS